MRIQGIKHNNQTFTGIHIARDIPSNVREILEEHEIFKANARKYDISFSRFILDNSINMTIEPRHGKSWSITKIYGSLTDDLSDFVKQMSKVDSQSAFEKLLENKRIKNSGWNLKRFFRLR